MTLFSTFLVLFVVVLSIFIYFNFDCIIEHYFKSSFYGILIFFFVFVLFKHQSLPSLSENAKTWKKKGKYLNYKMKDFVSDQSSLTEKQLDQSIKIFYIDSGNQNESNNENLPLFCIHGFPTSSFDWDKIWNEVSKKYRMIAIDMLGFGFSSKPDFDYKIFDQATLIERILSDLDLLNVNILAHDYGDTVTQELLARYEENVENKDKSDYPIYNKVVLLNGGIVVSAHRPILLQRLLNKYIIGDIIVCFMTKKSFGKRFNTIVGVKTTETELHDFWTIMNYNQGVKIYPRLIKYMRDRKINEKRWVSILSDTSIPLLYINGPFDPISGKHSAKAVQELIGEDKVIFLDDNIGHYPQCEDPKAVIKYVLEFF
eukprot:TRINITY_DN791_c2_g1_i2.p1 TRINITY_DN791_c2_g1~~TRINITY_DN791_c2_g1_i2.p1  ORF type:complete len:371 (-),score=76.34 TRINITY_DN791_c2_g1_i2:151-1263(-)